MGEFEFYFWLWILMGIKLFIYNIYLRYWVVGKFDFV